MMRHRAFGALAAAALSTGALGASIAAAAEPTELEARLQALEDHVRIEQVLTNLVSNAIKYSLAGSVVEVSLQRQAGQIELCVVDHGMGIAPKDLARIFEPFRRVGLSNGNVPGVGLGLFVVRKIVEAHGGRIDVESTLGRGSTFRVVLPTGPAGAE